MSVGIEKVNPIISIIDANTNTEKATLILFIIN